MFCEVEKTLVELETVREARNCDESTGPPVPLCPLYCTGPLLNQFHWFIIVWCVVSASFYLELESSLSIDLQTDPEMIK